jgi:hypothetical protein
MSRLQWVASRDTVASMKVAPAQYLPGNFLKYGRDHLEK